MKKPLAIKCALILLPFGFVIWVDMFIADPSLINATGAVMVAGLFISIVFRINYLRLVSGYISLLMNIVFCLTVVSGIFIKVNNNFLDINSIKFAYGIGSLFVIFTCCALLFYRPIIEFYKMNTDLPLRHPQ